MEKEEYFKELKEINEFHKVQKYKLAEKFVLSNNTVKVGDIITDHIGSIMVERITVNFSFNDAIPCAVFIGLCYTKKGEPFKNRERRSVWGGNLM